METTKEQHWHNLEEQEISKLLNCQTKKGLPIEEVARKLEKFGKNTLKKIKESNVFTRFILQFHQALVYILLAAIVMAVLLGEWIDAIVIFMVVLVNAIVGFLQESKALKALETLNKSIDVTTRVMRDGKVSIIPAKDIVPGDIVLLQSGDKVPADLRLIKVNELRIDESALTGESLPTEKISSKLHHDIVLADRTNMCFASTLVTYGQGTGIVVETGDRTEIGRISDLIANVNILKTPLNTKLHHFSKILLYTIIGFASLTFIIGIIKQQELSDIFMATIALIVAAIPEGLPAVFTIILSIGVSRMAKRNAIIRKLPAVETLGSTTIICSDKTGTLTENKMTVQNVIINDEEYIITGSGYKPIGDIMDIKHKILQSIPDALKECLFAGMVCNDSVLVKKDGEWIVEGDPTEGALIVAAHKAGFTEDYINKVTKVNVIPFESERQYMSSMHKITNKSGYIIYIKGAVEKIIDKCSFMLNQDNQIIEINKDKILANVDHLAKQGLRVLGFAKLEIMNNDKKELTHQDIDQGLTFLGIQGMIDPPRKEAMESIEACHRAGIKIKMITGDHAITAAAIARQMNIENNSNNHYLPKVIAGDIIAKSSDEELKLIAMEASVFARVTPEQKLRLVKALQQDNQIVAMTGDGVNDAPALKQANIGIAMGRQGTEVAKEAADMVLTDDNFATIKAAIEEGRGVFDNLIKFIVWTLPTNIGVSMIIFIAIIKGMNLPIQPLHVLWINMVTSLTLGLMLAFEKKEKNIMLRKPRHPDEPIINKILIFRIILVSLIMVIATFYLFAWQLNSGVDILKARTSSVNIIIFIQAFYLLNCRSLSHSLFNIGLFSNAYLILGIIAMSLLQIFFTYSKVANQLFHSSAISLNAWQYVLLAGLLTYIIIEIEKKLRKAT